MNALMWLKLVELMNFGMVKHAWSVSNQDHMITISESVFVVNNLSMILKLDSAWKRHQTKKILIRLRPIILLAQRLLPASSSTTVQNKNHFTTRNPLNASNAPNPPNIITMIPKSVKSAKKTYNLVLSKKIVSRLSPLWTQTLEKTSITIAVDNLQKMKVKKTVLKTDPTLMGTTVYRAQSLNILIWRKKNVSHVQVEKISVKRKKNALVRCYQSQK